MKLDDADAPVPVHVDGVPLVGTPGHVHEASGGVNVRVGSNVRLGGLKSVPELNGRMGEVTGYDETSGRYEVTLKESSLMTTGAQVDLKNSRTVKVKPANLTNYNGHYNELECDLETLPPSQQTWVTELQKEFIESVAMQGPDGAPRIPRVITEPTDPPAFLIEKPQAGIVPDFAIRTHCVWRRQLVPELSNGAEGYIYAAMFDRVEGGRRMTSGICSYRKSCAADGGQQIKAGMEAIMAIMQNNSKPDKDGTPPM